MNNDRWVDVAINSSDGPAVIAMNRASANHWLMVDTGGTPSNRDGIGAVLRLVSDTGKEQYAMASTAGSYLLEIRWPSRAVQTLTNIAADRILHVREPTAASGK